MSRPIISDDFGGERLQTQARPITPTVQAAPMVEDRRWEKLARVFDAGGVLIEQQQKQQREEETANAQRWAASMTVEELGKAIKDGKMLPSQSPVFAATVQHIWGQNTQAQIERDTLSKVTTGELKFNSPQEIDTWLVEARNTALSGASKYAAAGFDKTHTALRDKLMEAVARTNDKEIVQQAEVQATDALANTLLKVTAKDFQGTPDDAARTILEQYQLLRKTRVMNDQSARAALGDVVTRAATSGQTGLLDALLKQELPGLGTLRGFLGETKAATLESQAGNVYDQGQRQRIDDEVLPFYQAADSGALNVDKFMTWATSEPNKKYISAATIHAITRANMAAQANQFRDLQTAQLQGQAMASEFEARKRVDAAISNGSLWDVQGTGTPKVFTARGEVKDFDVKEYATAALKVKTANLPFDQQVSSWAMNGLENPDWKNQIQAGLMNLSSIGVDSQGKPTGQLNEAGRQSIELFKQMDSVNPDYAKQIAGETAYRRFSDINFLTHLGRNVNDAAAIASNAASGAIIGSDTDKLVKRVHAAVADLTERPWYKPEWALRMLGDNTQANTAQVTGAVRRYATLLAHSGQHGDAESAVAAVADYIARPQVSARINGTLYLRSELPAAPPSRTQDEWFERFLEEVPKARAQELKWDPNEVRLEYSNSTKAYHAIVGGVPLTDPEGGPMVISKTAIQQWYATREKQDVIEAAARGSETQADKAHEGFRKRLWGEVGALQKDDRYVIERYDGTYNHSVLERNIFSKDAYRRIVADDNQDKPLSELLKLYPSKK